MVNNLSLKRLEALMSLLVVLSLHERMKEVVLRYVRNHKAILELCDGTNTLTQIASKSKKDKGYLSRLFQRLENLGILYVAETKGREKYYKTTLPLEVLEEGLIGEQR